MELAGLNFTQDRSGEQAAAEALLGRVTEQAESTTMRTLYAGANGSAEFFMSGEFSVALDAGVYQADPDELERAGRDCLALLGMEAELVSRETRGAGERVDLSPALGGRAGFFLPGGADLAGRQPGPAAGAAPGRERAPRRIPGPRSPRRPCWCAFWPDSTRETMCAVASMGCGPDMSFPARPGPGSSRRSGASRPIPEPTMWTASPERWSRWSKQKKRRILPGYDVF